MKISGINFESIVDGPGVRLVIFVSGCDHHCKGCHNQATFDFNAGVELDKMMWGSIIAFIQSHKYITGVTLSGGDPLYSVPEITQFVSELKKRLPNTSIWLYTGFLYEDILKDPEQRALLELCDVLVDGEFILEQRDITLCYRGSRNQRIIDIQKSLHNSEIVAYEV